MKYLGFVAVLVFLFSCADDTRDNPYDMWAINYIRNSSAEGSSSSVGTGGEPSSSSGNEEPSSGSVGLSSSSVLPSSSGTAPSSSSSVSSSSSSSSSSLAPSSSSSAPPSSSSIAPSSSSSVPSSSSLGGGYTGSYGSLLYEGQTYKTVVIGTQTWMAENLNYAIAGSKCSGEGGTSYLYDEDGNSITKTLSPAEVQANCDKYGRLYDWSTAMGFASSCNTSSCSSQIQTKHKGICPSGWHISSQADWNVMTAYIGGNSTEGKKLKAKSGWNNNGNGTNDYGFSALPGGRGTSDGSFGDVGYYGYWWSASESEYRSYSNIAYSRGMSYYGVGADWDFSLYKSNLLSVRCLQD